MRFWIEVLWFCSSLRLCDPGTKVNWCYYVIFWIGSRMKSTALPSQVLHFKICKIRVPQLCRWPWVSAWHLQRIKATSLLICFPFKPLRPCSNQPECASCHNKRSSPQVCGVPVPFSTRVYAFGVVTITNTPFWSKEMYFIEALFRCKILNSKTILRCMHGVLNLDKVKKTNCIVCL